MEAPFAALAVLLNVKESGAVAVATMVAVGGEPDAVPPSPKFQEKDCRVVLLPDVGRAVNSNLVPRVTRSMVAEAGPAVVEPETAFVLAEAVTPLLSLTVKRTWYEPATA